MTKRLKKRRKEGRRRHLIFLSCKYFNHDAFDAQSPHCLFSLASNMSSCGISKDILIIQISVEKIREWHSFIVTLFVAKMCKLRLLL